jgi:quercetin dioxygenase-like cupin family protein
MTIQRNIDRRRLLQSGLAALVADLAATEAIAQDAVQTEPGSYRVVLENSKVRVLEFISRPRTVVCGVGRHSHPPHLTVALSDAKVRITLANGQVVEASNKLGDVFWSEAETHTVENIGNGVMRALIIEIKDGHGTPA